MQDLLIVKMAVFLDAKALGEANMVEQYIVIDEDAQRRQTLCTLLSTQGYVIPLGSIEEIGHRWPEHAWIFASCDRDNLQYICDYLQRMEKYFPIVPYGTSPGVRLLINLINAGCIGFLELPTDRSTLVRTMSAIRATAAKMIAHRVREASAAAKTRRLSPRETEVVKAVCRGLTNKGIARILGISPRTVEIHRAKAMDKLEANSTAEMVRLVMNTDEFGLFEDISAVSTTRRAA